MEARRSAPAALKGHTTPSLLPVGSRMSIPRHAADLQPPSQSPQAKAMHEASESRHSQARRTAGHCMSQVSEPVQPGQTRPSWKGCTPGRFQVVEHCCTGQADMMQYEGKAAQCVRSNHADRIGGPVLHQLEKAKGVPYGGCTVRSWRR